MPSLRASHLLIPLSLAATGAVLATVPSVLGKRVGSALDELRTASPAWLWGAVVLLALMHTATGLAWRAALGACGTTTSSADAVGRYSIGSAVNAITPLRVGSALRVALFARLVHSRGACWQVGGAALAAGAVRGAWFTALVAVAALTGAIPWWPALVFASVALTAAVAALVSRRIDIRRRIGRSLDAFRELGRNPRALAALALSTGLALTAKVGAAAAVAGAVGIESPLVAGLLVIPAVELAAILPLTPGNVGVASAAVAFALEAHGVPAEAALAAGIAWGAVEPVAALAMGGLGALGLFGPRVVPSVRVAAATTGALGFVGLCGATLVLAF
jgi:uncharacterized membrane protein YbhN (UPF0104 family)